MIVDIPKEHGLDRIHESLIIKNPLKYIPSDYTFNIIKVFKQRLIHSICNFSWSNTKERWDLLFHWYSNKYLRNIKLKNNNTRARLSSQSNGYIVICIFLNKMIFIWNNECLRNNRIISFDIISEVALRPYIFIFHSKNYVSKNRNIILHLKTLL